MEVEAKVEILAFMRARGYKPADGRAASGRFVRRARSDSADKWPRRPAARSPAPRACRHVLCQLWQERVCSERVPTTKARQEPAAVFKLREAWTRVATVPRLEQVAVTALEDAPRRVPIVFAVTDADGFTPVSGRRAQQPQLGDFIKTPVAPQPPKAGSRFRPLTLEDWQEIAAESSSARCAKGKIASMGPSRRVVASEAEVGGLSSKILVVSTVGLADFIALASTSHFLFMHILQTPCIEKSILQKLPTLSQI